MKALPYEKITLIIVGLFSLLILLCNPAYADASCPTVTKTDIAALLDQWDPSLQTGKPSKVAKNYADDAILIPTVSNKVRYTHLEIEDYFGFKGFKVSLFAFTKLSNQ